MAVTGIILAAGRSSRMHRNKMALPLADRPVIHHTIQSLRPASSTIIVVGGYNFSNLKPILSSVQEIQLVYNNRYDSGMFSSVQKGLSLVSDERCFILPGDIPMIGAETVLTMLEASGSIVIPSFNGRRGHPVLISSSLFPRILSLPVDSNLRDFIHQTGFEEIPVKDRNILLDIDEKEDYLALKRQIENQ